MIRARLIAFALVFGLCCLNPLVGFGQYQDGSWYGGSDDCVEEPYRFGPAVIFDGGFLRTEYLNWSLDDPGRRLLGAKIVGTNDPSQDFIAFGPGTSIPLALARVPTTGPVSLSDISGIRVTGGFDFINDNTLEISAFFLDRKKGGYLKNDFGSAFLGNPFFSTVPRQFATSTLVNGQLSDNLLLYNESFEVNYTSQLWGGEANYVIDFDRDGLFQLRPEVGLRYLNLHENLLQRGVFVDNILGLPPITSTIQSITYNNLYGPQVGARLEMVSTYINMGLESKLMVLGDTMLASVTTNRLRSNDDPIVRTENLSTALTVGVDLNGYAQMNVSRNFSIRVGYNFMWLNRVTRPEDNIYYNDNGPLPTPPGVVVKMSRSSDFSIHGVSLGGELRF